MKRLAVAGVATLGVLALSAQNASAATQSSGSVSMKVNPNCHVTLYVSDSFTPGKIEAQAHFTCDKGDNLFTPTISIDRDGTHGLGSKTAGPKAIDKDHGFGGFETAIADKSGTQCYRAKLLIVYPNPRGTEDQGVSTPCLNS